MSYSLFSLSLFNFPTNIFRFRFFFLFLSFNFISFFHFFHFISFFLFYFELRLVLLELWNSRRDKSRPVFWSRSPLQPLAPPPARPTSSAPPVHHPFLLARRNRPPSGGCLLPPTSTPERPSVRGLVRLVLLVKLINHFRLG